LTETFRLNYSAIRSCLIRGIPVHLLTKQTWWVRDFVSEASSAGTPLNSNGWSAKELLSIGFTLTGHDEQEPGCAPNTERIAAMKTLHNIGFRTWASIEPIINFQSSPEMISDTAFHCNLYKIGLQSWKEYNKIPAMRFFNIVNAMLRTTGAKIYWKDTFLKLVGANWELLPSHCIT
jgi:hypothetical protein